MVRRRGALVARSKVVRAIDRYDNGKVRYRGATLDGKMHGPWKFFRRDGSLMRAGSFDRGAQVGTWRTFDASGKVVKETSFARRSSS
jgi:antitoxin component YwqK of YwqJK toxin-antitoxin module